MHAEVEALRGDMGWSTFEERINQGKIKYRIRLEYMEGKRWAKKGCNWKNRNSLFKKDNRRRLMESK